MNKESQKPNLMKLLKLKNNNSLQKNDNLSVKSRDLKYKDNLNNENKYKNKISLISQRSLGKDIFSGETNINIHDSYKNENNTKLILKKNKIKIKNLKYESIDYNLKKNNSTANLYENERYIIKDKLKLENKNNKNLSITLKSLMLNNFKNDNNNNEIEYNNLDTNRGIKNNKVVIIDNDKDSSKIENNKLNAECLFCEKLFYDTQFFKNFKCNHYFCKECGEIFYRNLIEQGQKKKYKCPVFSCSSYFSDQFIKSLTSLKFYELKKIDYNNNNKKKNNAIFFERNLTLRGLDSKNSLIKNDNLDIKKNIIDINNTDNFYKYITKFLFECPLCKELTLYGKIKGPYFKCLKCLKKYCKYCRKEFNISHFDMSNKDYCKIFYRINKKKLNNNYFFIFYLKYLFLVIGAFLFIMTFFIYKLKNSFRIKNISKKLFFIFLFIILSLIFTPLSLLLIPYFPIINII